jgi:hypothetical protein
MQPVHPNVRPDVHTERRNMQVGALSLYTLTLQQNAHVCIQLKATLQTLVPVKLTREVRHKVPLLTDTVHTV